MADTVEKEQPAKSGVTPQSLVTEEHVKAALKADKGSDAHLSSWSVVEFTRPGDNYACVVSSVKVNFSLHDHNSEVVYIVKLNPCRSFMEFEEFTRSIFAKEAKFYLNLVPELNSVLKETGEKPLRFPTCFHGSLEPGKEIIFLEDLRARGFQMFDRRRGLDVPHATLILEELARLHAASRLLEDKTPGQDLTKTYDFLADDVMLCKDGAEDVITPVLAQHVNQGVAMLEKVGGYERGIAWLQNLILKLSDILKQQLGPSKYNVVCHGDCWNNNVLFRYDEEGEPVEVILLDLQINRFASPATDLNYMLYTSLTGEVRRPSLDAFLNIYHAAFTAVMEAAGKDTIFTRDQLKHEFRDKNTMGAIFAMMIIPVILLEQENVPDMNREDGNVEELMNELKTKALETLETNPLMRPRFLSLFDEMMETGLIP